MKEARENSREVVIRMRGIEKHFGKKFVHKGIDLDLYRGEVLTLMGGSGTGKSVLLRALIGLEKPDAGSIQFEGQEITQLDESQLIDVRKKIAYVFQYGALFDSLSVAENLAYPLREHTDLEEDAIRKKVSQTLAKVGLKGSESLLPADLSGGMQRRVGVARSIIMDPEVILYDEPTTGLDPFNTKQILEIILQLKSQGATAVLVTHDIQSMFHVSDRVAYLQHGKIASLSSVEEARERPDESLAKFLHGETM